MLNNGDASFPSTVVEHTFTRSHYAKGGAQSSSGERRQRDGMLVVPHDTC